MPHPFPHLLRQHVLSSPLPNTFPKSDRFSPSKVISQSLIRSPLWQPSESSSCFHSAPLTPRTFSTADILKLNGEGHPPTSFSYGFPPLTLTSQPGSCPTLQPCLLTSARGSLNSHVLASFLFLKHTSTHSHFAVSMVVPAAGNAPPKCLHLPASSSSLSFRAQFKCHFLSEVLPAYAL